MAPKTYKKKTYTKKVYKKPAQKKAVVNRSMVSLGQGFPKKLQMTHKYASNVQVTTLIGGMSNYLWSCNGLFDPDITGIGHQPMYFDQMTALYNHYTVIGAKITLKVLNASDASGLIACGIIVNDDTTTTPISLLAMTENSLASKPKYITYNSSAPVNLVSNWSAKKYFGGSVMANPNLQGTVAANPIEQSYFNFWVQAIDNGIVSVYVEAIVEYIAVWEELKDIGQS